MQSKDQKKNTLLIKGVTNSGKSNFLDRLRRIFPCETYVQQHGSPFDIDYKQQASYDHSRFKPSFILVDEGAFTSLIDNGAIEDLKLFLEGKGKALKTKHVTSVGMHWVGVPIIMTTNTLHQFMQQETFLKNKYDCYAQKKRCEDNEAHRKALKNRMNIVFIEQEHDGETAFPYDEKDLALYLYDLHLDKNVIEVDSNILLLEGDDEEGSLGHDEREVDPRHIQQPRIMDPEKFIPLDCSGLLGKR